MSDAGSTDQVRAALGFLPLTLRMGLAEDLAFAAAFRLGTRVIWTLPGGPQLDLRNLVDAARRWLAGGDDALEVDGQAWRFAWLDETGPTAALVLGDRRIPLPPVGSLSPDPAVRRADFERAAQALLLPPEAREIWLPRLDEGPLDAESYQAFDAICDLTPGRVMNRLRRSYSAGGATLHELAPPERDYWMQLAGPPPDTSDPAAYAEAIARRGLRLAELYGEAGIVRALQLAAHPSVSKALAEALGTHTALGPALESVAGAGGLMSVVAGLEVALALLGRRSDLRQPIEALTRRLMALDGAGAPTRFELLSGLFRLVDGEIAAAGVLADARPMWRRHATLTHASLLEELLGDEAELSHFLAWATQRDAYFYQQSLCDLRLEPRWQPWMAEPPQLRAELLGRVVAAAAQAPRGLTRYSREVLVGKGPRGLRSRLEMRRIFLPGPLEGGLTTPPALPDELRPVVEQSFAGESLDVGDLARLANVSLVFGLSADQAGIVADALRRSQYDVRGALESQQVEPMLRSLAEVSAITRSAALADDVRVLVRVYRRRVDRPLPPGLALNIGLVAAASRPETADWAAFFGDWASEIAYSDLDPPNAQTLFLTLAWLAERSADLAKACGPALAALEAILDR